MYRCFILQSLKILDKLFVSTNMSGIREFGGVLNSCMDVLTDPGKQCFANMTNLGANDLSYTTLKLRFPNPLQQFCQYESSITVDKMNKIRVLLVRYDLSMEDEFLRREILLAQRQDLLHTEYLDYTK